MLEVIGFGPSPFVRKVRIALLEKNIPFALREDAPWDSTTSTVLYNPLEKVPILIIPDAGSRHATEDDEQTQTRSQGVVKVIYDSRYILEYLELKYPLTTPLVNRDDIDARLLARKIEVVADGVGTAMQMRYFELERGEEARSDVWLARQVRKIDGGMAALQGWVLDHKSSRGRNGGGIAQRVGNMEKEFLVGGVFGLADVAVGAVCGFFDARIPEYDLRGRFPALWRYCRNLERRESFRLSVPSDGIMNDKIV